MNDSEKLLPPGQDKDLWGHRLFLEASLPVDWCTARQAAEIDEANVKPESILELIASGKVESAIYTREEAVELLKILL